MSIEVTRVLRDERPSSKIVTLATFSTIKERNEIYQSSIFEAAGYKWRLLLYINGNPKDGGNGHISLYVRIEETASLPTGWEVKVDLKLFVYNGKQNKYLTVTDGAVKVFNNAKKELGFGQLIPLPNFHNAEEGYLVDDTASFGAEIFVLNPAKVQEKVTFISNPLDNVFTWKILNFPNLEDKLYYSDEFLVGDRYWKIGFKPKGSGNALLLSIYACGFSSNAGATNTWTWGTVILRMKNQLSSNHKEFYFGASYDEWHYGRGANIISFEELNDASKGYLVNDAIILEAEIPKVSVTNYVPI